jgi:CheY-like chemotaxis protein
MISVLSEKNIAYGLRADEYLVKPVTQDELIETIEATMAKNEKKEVLVVDDDDNYLNLMGQILREESLSYRLVNNGNEALELIQEKVPDIIILDIMMPEKDGFSVIDEIDHHKEWKDISIIVVTSKDLTSKEKIYLRKRASMIIQKSGTHIDSVMETVINKVMEKTEAKKRKY